MKEFVIKCKNEAGSLATITETLANASVNVQALASEANGNGMGNIRVVTSDETTTKEALEKSGFDFTVGSITSIRLLDRPGELAKVSKKLAALNVNIRSIYILGGDGRYTSIALNVDDPEKALKVLK
ncbi:MAG: ACT domain-containing protein [Candidatus Diapherotrites archaeon]|nr:ACT domain-containing protein [Candidatus Diapherotrites archaeon]